jgi:predicted 3-demethylubiquinone-9 3-methyltransferase (glyoxalase superfamily)
MKNINPCLWFDTQAEEAARLYTSLFKNSKIGKISRYGKEGPGPEGSVLTVDFQLNGQDYLALNGGPIFKFTEAVSFVANCENQEEVDFLWEKLSEGGEKSQCGWLMDKFGLSWQIVPTRMGELMSDPDPVKTGRVMQAMLQMTKLDIAKLEAAYNGR